MSHFEKLIKLAATQHGVVATRQLHELDIPSGSVQRLMRNSMLKRTTRGVFLVEGFPETWHRNAIACVLGAGSDALLSHESALINLELLPQNFVSYRNEEMVPFHVTIPRSGRNRVKTHIHRSIYEDSFLKGRKVNAIPQVAPNLSIIESSRFLRGDFLSSVVDQAIRKSYVSARSLTDKIDEVWTAPGRGKSRLIEILQDYTRNSSSLRKSESVLESRVMRAISPMVDAKVHPQYRLNVGAHSYRIDIAVPELRLAIEIDGFEFHRTRHQFDNDRIRQNFLVASGWTVLRFTSSQSDDEIRNHLSRALGVLTIARRSK